MSYTPTQWENGDVITKEKMNKIEEGIANAGGGGGQGFFCLHFYNEDETYVYETYEEVYSKLAQGLIPILLIEGPIGGQVGSTYVLKNYTNQIDGYTDYASMSYKYDDQHSFVVQLENNEISVYYD